MKKRNSSYIYVILLLSACVYIFSGCLGEKKNDTNAIENSNKETNSVNQTETEPQPRKEGKVNLRQELVFLYYKWTKIYYG